MGDALVRLWVPVVVFAHMFAGYWLLQALFLTRPKLKQKLRSIFRLKARQPTPPREASRASEDTPEHRSTVSHHGITVQRRNTMSPVRMTTLEWRDIGYTVLSSGQEKVVLRGIYGVAYPYQMLAVLGPSGCGKSTLLDILTNRKTSGKITGQLMVNGKPPTKTYVKKMAYIPQFDNFVPTMTTYETLEFFAKIILPARASSDKKKEAILHTLHVMGLYGQRHTLVGGTLPGGLLLRGLSGGERKRLSIGSGILARPSVVMLDEPTSGLDSYAALNVMGYMQRMAEGGRTVVASIHQPRAAIWNMFQRAELLSKGLLMYHGPSDKMVNWFEGLGHQYNEEQDGVPSDWAIDLVSVVGFGKAAKEAHTDSMKCMEQLIQAAAAFRVHYQAQLQLVETREAAAGRGSTRMDRMVSQTLPESEELSSAQMDVEVASRNTSFTSAISESDHEGSNNGYRGGSSREVEFGTKPSFAAKTLSQKLGRTISLQLGRMEFFHGAVGGPMPAAAAAAAAAAATAGDNTLVLPNQKTLGDQLSRWWQHYRMLVWREYLSVTRNPANVAGRMLTFVWLAMLASLMNYDLPNTAETIRNRNVATFTMLCFYMLIPFVFMSMFVADKQFYLADAASKLYHPSAYYAAKLTVTVPFNIIISAVFCLTIYGMIGLRHSASAMLLTTVLSTLMSLVSLQVLYLSATIAPHQDIAFMIAIAWTAINLLVNGSFILYRQITLDGMRGFRYVSALGYAWEGIMRQELGGRNFNCSSGLGLEAFGLAPQFIPKPNGSILALPIFTRTLYNPGADCVAVGNVVLRFFQFNTATGTLVAILVGYWGFLILLTYLVLWWQTVVRQSRH